LKVSSLAQLILPWHQALDAVIEAERGESKIGTTLKGIGPAYADKALRVGIRAGEVRNHDRFVDLVRTRAHASSAVLSARGAASIDVDAVVQQFSTLAMRLAPFVSDTVNTLHDALDVGKHVLLEGAQATFLDIDHGTYPYVTSSHPISGGATVGTGLGPRDINRVVGITKAYTTRVGAGPFPTELTDDRGDRIVDIGKEFGTVTGRRRRPGWLDLVMLRHAVRLNSLTDLALTKLDGLDDFDSISVCTGYQLDGTLLRGYPDDVSLLERVTPVYVTLEGWKTALRNCRSYNDLPDAARKFVELIEREVGVPVSMIGVGPGRDECVVRS